MRDPNSRPRGRFQQYRRSNSLNALSPPSYEESERDTAQSVSNVETPLPNYEQAMLRSSSLHDLLHADEPPRVPLPEIPPDWNREGPSLENGRCCSNNSSEQDGQCVEACCYGCCCLFLVIVLWLVFMGLAFHFVEPRNFIAAWVIFTILFFLPVGICSFPCWMPLIRRRRSEDDE